MQFGQGTLYMFQCPILDLGVNEYVLFFFPDKIQTTNDDIDINIIDAYKRNIFCRLSKSLTHVYDIITKKKNFI